MTIGPPIPEIQFDLENSKSKVKVKGTPVSAVSSWLISLVFHIHPIDFCPFRSMTIGPPILEIQFDLKNSRSKVKVTGQGQRYPSQHSIQLTHFLFVSHQLDQPFLRYGKYNIQLQKTDLKFHAKKITKNKMLAELLQNLIRWKAWLGGYTYQFL